MSSTLKVRSHAESPGAGEIRNRFRLSTETGFGRGAPCPGCALLSRLLDYDHARDELAIAVRTLPNNARIFEWSGYIDRRQNRWHDAVRDFERAMELDPRNINDPHCLPR